MELQGGRAGQVSIPIPSLECCISPPWLPVCPLLLRAALPCRLPQWLQWGLETDCELVAVRGVIFTVSIAQGSDLCSLFAALPSLAVPGMWNLEHLLTCTWQFVSVSLQLEGQWGLCALIADPLKCWLFKLLEFFINIKSLHKWSCTTSTKYKRGEVKLKIRYVGLQSTKINTYLSWSLNE